MTCRIALVSPVDATDLVHSLGRIVPELSGAAAHRGSWGWSWQVQVEHDEPMVLRDLLRQALAQADPATPLDLAVIPGALATQAPRVLMMDVDSTFTTSEAIDELAHEAGQGAAVAAITERAMRGELDFAASLRERVATLEGLDESALARVAARTQLSPGARELVAAAVAAGVRVGLVSGGFTAVVEPVAAGLGIADITANRLEVVDGRLTGRTLGEVIDRAAKARHLLRNCEVVGCGPELAVAVGDGANDLDMIGTAGLGIAWCAKPLAAAQADASISFARLDAVWGMVSITG